jgi:isopenicillin-N N-acyltransferase-like protein
MGAKLGEECCDLAEGMMRMLKARLKLTGMDLRRGRALSSKYLPYAEEYDPDYLDFLKAYAEAAGQEFDDIFVHFCLDEKGFCTDIAVNGEATADGDSVFSAHTEDWVPDYAGHVVLVRARPESGPRFLALSLCGAEIDCGMNSEGISFTANSVYSDDTRIGVPKMFNARRVLASRSMGDAVEAAFPEKRASSYNHNLCHRSGEMFSVEGSATDFSVIPAEHGWLVHTNHYLSERMSRHDLAFSSPSGRSPGTAPSTLLRYHRACNLLRKNLGDVSVDVLKSILEDHFNYPRSICCHADERLGPEDRSATIFSVIFDLSRLEAHVCPTNPCSGVYGKYSLLADE